MVSVEDTIRLIDWLVISLKNVSRSATQIDLPLLTSSTRVRCREISGADLIPIVDLLTTGFKDRNRQYWLTAIDRLSEYDGPGWISQVWLSAGMRGHSGRRHPVDFFRPSDEWGHAHSL